MQDAIKLSEKEYLKGNDIYVEFSKVDKHYPLHFHEFYELELAVEGTGTQIVNGNPYEIRHDTLFMYRPSDFHEIIATTPLRIYDVAFNTTMIDEEAVSNFVEFDNNNIIITLTPNKTRQIASMLALMFDISQSKRTNKRLILSHLLNAILLVAVGAKQMRPPLVGPKNNNDILQYIHKNFARSPSLQEMSDFCGYQKNYFCEIFKERTGMTYVQYLTQYKLNHSKRLLKISNKSIKEISEECGFKSPSNYIREFKKYNHITPKQFQKAYLSQSGVVLNKE
ncbi:MAG: AraC family transcriptional regulator [Bacilli bacterium]|nr:AraC family transcriptional regulator [Bacilli bacterium]